MGPYREARSANMARFRQKELFRGVDAWWTLWSGPAWARKRKAGSAYVYSGTHCVFRSCRNSSINFRTRGRVTWYSHTFASVRRQSL